MCSSGRVHRLPLLLLLLWLLRSHPGAALIIICASVVGLPLLLLVRWRPRLPLLRPKPQVLSGLLSEIGISCPHIVGGGATDARWRALCPPGLHSGEGAGGTILVLHEGACVGRRGTAIHTTWGTPYIRL